MLATFTFFIVMALCLLTIEDFFLDIYFYLKNLGPRFLTPNLWKRMTALNEKSIAIMVANWKESDVIERMVKGNLNRIQYRNYHFFIGVYPNDIETLQAAQKVESQFPHNVHVIINSEQGPTSKGQMLNQIVHGILRQESALKTQFDIFLMQDSEDILHPRSLKIINSEIEKADFLQTPIFSFRRQFSEWVGSTYVDEFAELHTKDLFIRHSLGAPVPSAGVGTALNRSLMLSLIKNNNGNFLREDSLTEDYVLGMTSASHGFKTAFVCYYYKNNEKKKELVATREYFPSDFKAAFRQKSRWVLGIVFQGIMMIDWKGPLIHKYYLYRDRRGPLVNILSFVSIILSIYFLVSHSISSIYPSFFIEKWFQYGSLVSLFGLTSRFFHRLYAVIQVNGFSFLELLQILLRWPLGVFINVVASLRALNQFQRFLFLNEPLRWVKTTHILPENFGLEASEAEGLSPNKETENAIQNIFEN